MDAKQSEKDAKEKARARSRASKPGAVAVAADEAARLDRRIAEKSSPSSPVATPRELNRLEQDVHAKQQAARLSNAYEDRKPGAVAVSNGGAELDAFESRVASKSRSTPGAQAALSDLENRINAKVSSQDRPTPTGLTELEDRINSKIRGAEGSVSNAGRAQLQGLEDSVAAKEAEYGVARDQRSEVSRLDERIASKNAQVAAVGRSSNGMHQKMPPPAPVASLKGAVDMMDEDYVQPPTIVGKKGDDYQEQPMPEKGDDDYGADPLAGAGIPGVNGGIVDDSDLEYGVYDDPDNTEGLAVAVPVMEDDDDVFIPSAVEYDPDAKPPIYRNRRFRLYSFLAFFVLVVVAVGAGVGIALGRDESYDPEAGPTSYRENLGIRDQVERVIGGDSLDDPSSPYYKALQWITFRDPLELTPDDPNFLQRYFMVYFFYATSVQHKWHSCNPPEEGDDATCTFQKLAQVVPLTRIPTPSIRWLSEVSECRWAGVLCDQFDQIRAIDLNGSNMTGSFPSGVQHLPFVQSLSIAWGQLTGPLPKEIPLMKHLVNLELHYNAFTGAVPEEWWQSRNLQRINLSVNQISGPISKGIKGLRDIKGLYAFDNLLTGSVPEEIGNLASLTYLRMQRNLLEGTIPTTVGGLKSLYAFWLNENDLSGTIPTEFGLLPKMSDFRVFDNEQMTGEIPDELLKEDLWRLDLFNCNFTGVLSEKIPLMSGIHVLRIHNNNFRGQLPTDMGTLMPDIESLWLSGNDFTGAMPQSVCDLRGEYLFGLYELVADCSPPRNGVGGPEIFCDESCCTECCDASGGNCLPTSS